MPGTKKYKKGMTDAAESYKDFGQKQEDAVSHILEEVRQGNLEIEEALKQVAALGENVDSLYAYLTSREKASAYSVYTPADIQDLGNEEKLFLAGALLALSKDRTPNEAQQNYIRAVNRYLDIKEPPFGVDPLKVEEIEATADVRAIYQVALEYLRLQDGDCYDETDLQREFLDAFNLNSRRREEILEHVELLYTATGAQGLAEKYGYVPEEDEEEYEAGLEGEDEFPETDIGLPADPAAYEEITIRYPISIGEYESRTFEDQIVHLQSDITCEGTLEFNNCVIHYGETDAENLRGGIKLGETASLTMSNCTVEGHSCNTDPIIDADDLEKNREIRYLRCTFINCCAFTSTCCANIYVDQCSVLNPGDRFINGGTKITVTGSEFRFTDVPDFFPEENPYGTTFECRVIDCDGIEISDCIVKGPLRMGSLEDLEDPETEKITCQLEQFVDVARGKSRVENCIFSGVSNIFNAGSLFSVRNSIFEHCYECLTFETSSPSAEILNCRFDNCLGALRGIKNGKISYCQFNNCFDNIIETDFKGGSSINFCEFNNCSYTDDNYFHPSMLLVMWGEDGRSSVIEHCVFNGMSAGDGYIIEGSTPDKANGAFLTVENCAFLNCRTDRDDEKLIKDYDTYLTTFGKKRISQKTTNVYDCTGLDQVNRGGCRNDNVNVKTTDSAGHAIGAPKIFSDGIKPGCAIRQ